MTTTQAEGEPVEISDPSLISKFLEWATVHIDDATGIDESNRTLRLREFGEAAEVTVHFEPREWTKFANWFKTVGGPRGDIDTESLFDLLATYVEQGLAQNLDASDLYLYNYGIWPPGLASPKGGVGGVEQA